MASGPLLFRNVLGAGTTADIKSSHYIDMYRELLGAAAAVG